MTEKILPRQTVSRRTLLCGTAGPLGRAALSSAALAQNTAPARTGGGTAIRVYRLS